MRSRLLLDLQQLDLRRDAAVLELKQIVASLGSEAALRQARQAVDRRKEQLSDIERRLRLKDLERQGVKDRIAQEEGRLYGGRVKSPKELQSLQQEVTGLRRRLSALDDQVLELMLERDDASAALEAAEAALSAAESDTATTTRVLQQQKEQLTAEVRDLEAQRQELTRSIPPGDLALYEQLRQSKGGRAVAELSGGNCQACGMQLPRHVVDRVPDGDDIVQCPACGRILHG